MTATSSRATGAPRHRCGAAAEREVAPVGPVDDEGVGIVEHRRVPVGRPQAEQHRPPGGDRGAGHLHRLDGPPHRELHRAVIAGDLLPDRRGPAVGVGDEVVPGPRRLEQPGQGVGQQVSRRVEPGVEEEDRVVELLVGGEVRSRGEDRHQVVAGVGPAGRDLRRQERHDLRQGDTGAVGGGVVRPRVEPVDQRGRPPAEVGRRLGREAQQAAQGVHGDLAAHVRHEVCLPVAFERDGEGVEAVGDVGVDRGRQRLDGMRPEAVRHRTPPPRVHRRVGRQDQVLPVLGEGGRRPAGVATDLGRADGPTAQEPGDVGVARDDPRPVGQLERGRPVPQVPVQGRRVAVQHRIGRVEGGSVDPGIADQRGHTPSVLPTSCRRCEHRLTGALPRSDPISTQRGRSIPACQRRR